MRCHRYTARDLSALCLSIAFRAVCMYVCMCWTWLTTRCLAVRLISIARQCPQVSVLLVWLSVVSHTHLTLVSIVHINILLVSLCVCMMLITPWFNERMPLIFFNHASALCELRNPGPVGTLSSLGLKEWTRSMS